MAFLDAGDGGRNNKVPMFFAFAKQAFCNYYFLVIGMFCAALAAVSPRTDATVK